MQPATNKTHTLTGGEGKGASVYVHGIREATGEEAIEGLTYYTFVYVMESGKPQRRRSQQAHEALETSPTCEDGCFQSSRCC